MNTTRSKAAQAIISDFRRWYADKYGKAAKRITIKRPQATAK